MRPLEAINVVAVASVTSALKRGPSCDWAVLMTSRCVARSCNRFLDARVVLAGQDLRILQRPAAWHRTGPAAR